jgi:hypothetical protein
MSPGPKTDAEVFDIATAMYGGRLDVTSCEPSLAELVTFSIRRARSFAETSKHVSARVPRIVVDAVDNSRFDALATFGKDCRIIAIFKGAIQALDILFHRLLADRRIFDYAGEPSLEGEIDPVPALSADTIVSKCGNLVIRPKCEFRALYARHLANTALDFVVGHELGHIMNGHVDCEGLLFGGGGISEFGFRALEPAEARIQQTLEMNADNAAAASGIGSVFIKLGDPDGVADPWYHFYQDPKKSFLDWLIAVGCFFRLFGDQTLADVELARSSHPPWRARCAMLMSTAGFYLTKDRPGLSQSDVHRLVPIVLTAVEEAFEALTGEPRRDERLKNTFNQDVWAYADELHDCWANVVRPKLEPYAFVELPRYFSK